MGNSLVLSGYPRAGKQLKTKYCWFNTSISSLKQQEYMYTRLLCMYPGILLHEHQHCMFSILLPMTCISGLLFTIGTIKTPSKSKPYGAPKSRLFPCVTSGPVWIMVYVWPVDSRTSNISMTLPSYLVLCRDYPGTSYENHVNFYFYSNPKPVSKDKFIILPPGLPIHVLWN